ncbi:LLM class flavin-dependent oxidoreductase [Aeromicrobium sp. UC242_57]|uniref:LLM class flavin-dependent oxidoreductase n=1 Tax=Aeromicrobium sp. UC242_57 TaxID=3374624 RepID=UPI0037B16D23
MASGSPAVLLAAIGAHTKSIRLGSGGVMLPNHQPLVVAEQFLMLEGLYPGRVDLGIGRSLGFTSAVRQALRHDRESLDLRGGPPRAGRAARRVPAGHRATSGAPPGADVAARHRAGTSHCRSSWAAGRRRWPCPRQSRDRRSARHLSPRLPSQQAGRRSPCDGLARRHGRRRRCDGP